MATRRPRTSWLYWTVRWGLRELGFAYFRLRLDGLAHLPAQGPAILAGNHPSVLDGILEGTTSDRGRMRAVKRGVGLLALKTGSPVIPFGIAGSDAAYPEGARMPRPVQVTLAIHPGRPHGRVTEYLIPMEVLQRTLEAIRLEIREAMGGARALIEARGPQRCLKRAQVLLSACLVCPLAAFLSATANPSLESW